MNRKGLYLVISLKQEQVQMLNALEKALREGLAAVQVYAGGLDDMPERAQLLLCRKITDLCAKYNTPSFINNDWELLTKVPFDGVHFDSIPTNWLTLRAEIKRPFFTGVTLTNDISLLPEVKQADIDYLSFCAMFPSSSVTECEIVHTDTVKKTLNIVDIPVFLSGGITPENTTTFNQLNISGVAVISGVMNADDPAKAVREYKAALSKFIEL